MKQPVNEIDGPSGGWSYVDPRTGIDFKDHALQAILGRVYKSWLANDIPIPDNWADVVRHEICEQRPDIECREIGEPEVQVTLDDITRFGATITNWLTEGGVWVDREESERRAAICVKCHDNKHVKLCLGCNSALSWLAQRIGWPESSRDAELTSCRKCKCLLKLKIHMPLNVMPDGDIKYPDHCWAKNRESE